MPRAFKYLKFLLPAICAFWGKDTGIFRKKGQGVLRRGSSRKKLSLSSGSISIRARLRLYSSSSFCFPTGLPLISSFSACKVAGGGKLNGDIKSTFAPSILSRTFVIDANQMPSPLTPSSKRAEPSAATTRMRILQSGGLDENTFTLPCAWSLLSCACCNMYIHPATDTIGMARMKKRKLLASRDERRAGMTSHSFPPHKLPFWNTMHTIQSLCV
mmetsp:Transcript_34362/g.88856  ORF Transcript_34362/g.88856 Transcript_34362/m.88856 type:complete len:215 (+) Transcript_34362:3103-3747(+)